MSDNLTNIELPINEWVNLYTHPSIGADVGTALSIENIGSVDVYLAVQATQPTPEHDSYNIVQRGNGIRVQNNKGDEGAWAFCNSDGGKIQVMPIAKTGFYPHTGVVIKTSDGENSDGNNPIPVKDIDGNNRNSLNTVFGEKITGRRIPSVATQFQYGLPSDFATETLANGGTAVIEDSLSKLATGTDPAGSAAIQTNEYLRYIPGHEAYFFFTMSLTQGVADSFQRVGLYDDNDGFYLGYEGTDFCVSRMRAGVIEDRVSIDLSGVFEIEDGVFDPTKGNVYRLSFGYLGFAAINFEVMSPCGRWRLIHRIEYPNTENVTHITQTNLPARAQVTNTGNTTNLEFRSGSLAFGVVNGGGTDPSSRIFTDSNISISISSGVFEVITVRNKTTFNSLENRIKIRLMLLSISTELNRPVNWQLIKNADITNTPTWNDFNTQDSVVELSNDAQIDPLTGTALLAFNMAKEESFFEKVEDLIIDLRAGEYATFITVTPGGTSGDVNLAVRWKELF